MLEDPVGPLGFEDFQKANVLRRDKNRPTSTRLASILKPSPFSTDDFFIRLPDELIREILQHSPFKNVAKARLTSRAIASVSNLHDLSQDF